MLIASISLVPFVISLFSSGSTLVKDGSRTNSFSLLYHAGSGGKPGGGWKWLDRWGKEIGIDGTEYGEEKKSAADTRG